MNLTLPEIETAIAKLEKTWNEVGGSIDLTYNDVEVTVLRAFAEKHRLETKISISGKYCFCSLQITKGDNQMTIALWAPITEKSNKQKAPVGAGA